ncbi:biliverdin-producing heme oxygenase [Acidimangrovimonas sediminis]|uniref:biliverdin-producing heme oxygenase n=1 Tax=Acidimangrovimonas sediminis TaxID=2056283 RepID=UPI000C80E558|nr:biliverdin-producing heme oxygenase [Acidimangrovimonas sediminis]
MTPDTPSLQATPRGTDALPPRSARLREATHDRHALLDAAIMAARPFENTANYSRFLKVQNRFHHDVSPLYADPDVAAVIADLEHLSRLGAVCDDMRDLGVADDSPHEAPAAQGLALPEALGWLYVVEGSNLGAAFLLKAARGIGLSEDHGARHLAGAPEGRAEHWRTFKGALDAVPLSPTEEARAVDAAHAAFARVQTLVDRYMA